MKFLIYLEGSHLAYGATRGEFKFSPEHNVYLWKGEIYDAHGLNREIRGALTRYAKLGWVVLVKAVDIPKLEPDRPSEITLDRALEVVETLAPHRLKKKTGPKSELMEV